MICFANLVKMYPMQCLHFNINFLPMYSTVLYECCPGYMRMEGMKGCPAGNVSIIELNEKFVLCEEKRVELAFREANMCVCVFSTMINQRYILHILITSLSWQ